MNTLHKKISGLFSTQRYHEVGTESLLNSKKRRYKDAEGRSEESLDDVPFHHRRSSRPLQTCILTISLLLFALLSIALAFAYALKTTSDRDCGIQTGVFCEFQCSFPPSLSAFNFLDVLLC